MTRWGIASLAVLLAVATQSLVGTSSASAAAGDPATYYPAGPQTNVPVATVTGDGWTQCYIDKYANDLHTALPGLLQACTGNYLMLAGRATGSSTLSLLAAAPRADVLFDTGNGNTTHVANGTGWYFNDNWSWGFANQGDAVSRNNCDTLPGPLRLCWHTNDAGGYRVGDTTGLNGSTDYERLVYQADAVVLPQTITFTSAAPTDAVPGSTYTVAATGGASGNPVTFTIAAGSSGVCSVDGSTVTFAHPGDCVIDADQAGTTDYLAAPQTQQTVTVGKAAQAITFTSAAPTDAVPGSTYTVAATGGASGNPVTFSVAAGSAGVCSVDGSTVTFAHPGDCVIDADQAGTTDYLAAPQTQQAVTVSKAAQAITFTSTAPTDAVVGTKYDVAATGGASGSPVTFSLPAASEDVCSLDGSTVTFTHPGDCVVDADQAGTTDYLAAPQAQQHVAVAQASTTTSVTVGRGRILAHVVAKAPGAGTPTGSVTFTVGTATVGSAPLVDGTATLIRQVPAGATRTVAARYSGDADFTASSASTARKDPRITASISSARPKSSRGWYSAAVTVRFHCAANGAPLATACPAPATLRADRAGQSATGTVTAVDGGVATVAVTGIDIDTVKPKVRIAGIRRGATYVTTPKPRCVARDQLSGVASCRLTHRKTGDRIRWKAVATDKAGNTRKVTVRTTVLPVEIQGAPQSGGVFTVVDGRTYTLVVKGTATRPVYYDAARAPHRPVKRDKAFLPAGHHRWALGVTMGPAMSAHSRWNLGVKIGGKLLIVEVRVR